MTKVGLLGGSHVQGVQPYANSDRYTQPLDYHLSNAIPEMKFYNTAISGRGTERYLNCLVQLIENYDIDTVLVDEMSNRSLNYFWWNEPEYLKLIEKHENENIEEEIAKTFSMYEEQYATYAHRSSELYTKPSVIKDLPKSMISNWNDITVMLGSSSIEVVLGIRDLYNTRKLCERLGIKFVMWSFNLELKPLLINTFSNYEVVSCDGHHMNDDAMEWAAKKFFKGKLYG